MRPSRLFLALAPVAVLGACAMQGPKPAVTPVAVSRESLGAESPYGLFLAGQAAVNRGQSEAAAGYFGRAARVEAAPDAGLLNSRAFAAALLAGDIARAAALAPDDATGDPGMRRLGAVVRGVEALARGDGRKAYAILGGAQSFAGREPAAALLAPFAAAAAGNLEASIARPVLASDTISQFFADLDQGEFYERAGRYDEAETALRALIARGDPGAIASLKLGGLLERRGRGADAVAIYDQASRRMPGDKPLEAARRRATQHGAAPPLASIRQSAAEALIAPATAQIVQKQDQVALAYLRLALRLDPSRDEAWLLVGDILATLGDNEAARAAYGAPGPTSDQYPQARNKLAWSWQTAGDKERAVRIARETFAAAPANQDAAVTLADLLRANERYDDSAKVLDGLIAAQGDHADWRWYYMRAVDFEELGRWAEAERDLQVALKGHPDDPELLNFLGYSWIDRGEKLPQALAMVQKAVSLNPDSGAMIDSLGWGYYRLGDYKTAVEKLEAAVVLEPADPDVNNHLGDAYWRAGRRTEADYQWRRVLSLAPSAKLRAQVEAKLKSGLAAPVAPAVIAAQ